MKFLLIAFENERLTVLYNNFIDQIEKMEEKMDKNDTILQQKDLANSRLQLENDITLGENGKLEKVF